MTKIAMNTPSKLGPGEYLPDPTQSIQRIEDLPRPKVLKQSRNYPHRAEVFRAAVAQLKEPAACSTPR